MAKDWLSAAELQKDASIYGKFVLTIAGVAAWDFLSTLPFDWSIISGKRKWRWPMALYFIARICMILHIFAYAVNLNAISRIPCIQVVWISKVTDAIGTPIASGILLLRTAAVWHQNKKVWIPLVCMLLGQIVLWLQTFRYSRSEWNEQRKACVILKTAPNPLLVTVFSYTMAFDFIIMVLCSYRLFKARSTSAISNLLFRDGIVYFAAAFGANLLQAVLGALALNPVMNIFALPFALVVSVIASTAVFRNVFTLYDDFSGGPSSNSRPTTSGQGVVGNTMGARTGTRKMSMSKKNNNTGVDSFALNPVSHAASRDHQAFGLGGIEVTRVVDVNVDIERGGQHYTTSSGKKGTLDDDSDGWPDREDQKSHLPIPHDVDHLRAGNLGTLSTLAILPIPLSKKEPMFNASSPLRYKADVEVVLEPEYPVDDREFLINAVQKHISLSVANLTMVADLRPYGAHFLPILLEAVARFQHEMSTSEEDDIKSEASDPDDPTYKEEWDTLELVQWMLDVYRNMSPRAVEIYSDLMQIMEKRLERRWAEIGSSEAQTEVTEAVAERPDDGWDIGHHSTGTLGLSFSRLPPEIVGEIFLHAANDVPLMPVTLSHIDRFSRNVAINLSKLWDRISIRLAPRIVELYFERSKAAPLIVDAVLPPLLGYWTPRTSRRMKEFMAAMQPHGRRIQVLKFRQYFVGFVDLSELLDLLTTSSLGEDLKVLEIGETGDQVQDWPEDQLPDFDRWKYSPSAPECITIYGSCPTIWVLRTISFGRLVRLEIADNSDLRLGSLLGGLGRSPLLETLKLSNCIITAGQSEQEFPTISLSVLHTLEVIHTGAPGLPFFDHLGPFPKLTTFAMAFVEIDDKRPDTEFTRFMRRHPSIRNVQLDDFFTSTEGWKLVFGCFSFTTHLRLSNCFLKDENLAILCGSVDDVSLDVLMPNLTHITLDNEWELHSEAISRLVKQRLAWCADRKDIVIQPLQSVVLRGWDDAKMNKDDIDLIRGSVKDFVLETVWGDGTESEASSDSGRDYEYCWSDIDPNELAFEQ